MSAQPRCDHSLVPQLAALIVFLARHVALPIGEGRHHMALAARGDGLYAGHESRRPDRVINVLVAITVALTSVGRRSRIYNTDRRILGRRELNEASAIEGWMVGGEGARLLELSPAITFSSGCA